VINTLYKTTNLKNNRFYIGVHETEDVGFGTESWKDPYIGSGVAIEKAIKKYGRDSFLVEIIAYFDDKKEAYLAEADIVTKEFLKCLGKRTYNRTPGGTLPPTTKDTIWINNGITDKRIENSKSIPEGWTRGRINMVFSEQELERRRQFCLVRNLNNNPMSNTEVIIKMTKTKLEGYANGAFVPHNKGKKKNATSN